MNALELLEQQHEEVAALFEKLESSSGEGFAKKRLFDQIADALAVHSEIEEKIFYPAVKSQITEEILDRSVDEHLEVKQKLAELMALEVGDEEFDSGCLELKEDVVHHVGEEQNELFPKVETLLDAATLEELGQEMEEMAEDLVSENAPMRPREMVPIEAGVGPAHI
jgi:hypothetical protein